MFTIFILDSYSIWLTSRQYCKQEQTSEAEHNDEHYEEGIKNKILEASLVYVKDLGWSKESLVEGAKAAGYPGVTHGMFVKGGADLVHFFQTKSNENLVEFLKKVY